MELNLFLAWLNRWNATIGLSFDSQSCLSPGSHLKYLISIIQLLFSQKSHFSYGKFLDVIGTKILRLLLHCIHSHLHQLILLTPLGFLRLELCTATDESTWELGFVCIISLFTFESSILLSLITIYLTINTYTFSL